MREEEGSNAGSKTRKSVASSSVAHRYFPPLCLYSELEVVTGGIESHSWVEVEGLTVVADHPHLMRYHHLELRRR